MSIRPRRRRLAARDRCVGERGFRLLRCSTKGPELARLAAQAIGQSDAASIERLESVWTASVRLLIVEVLIAIPVIFLGVLIGR